MERRFARSVEARADDEDVLADELLGVPGQADPAVDEDHQVVADPLDVGERVRREHDGDAFGGDRAHQLLEQLEPGDRVEVRDRLIEQQQLRPLPERERERDLGPLAGGERPDPAVEGDPEAPEARGRVGRIPARVEPPSRLEHLAGGEVRVERAILADESGARQERDRVGRRREPEDRDVAGGRGTKPDRQLQEGGLPRAVRPDEPDDLSRRKRHLALAERGPTPESLGQIRRLKHCGHSAPPVRMPAATPWRRAQSPHRDRGRRRVPGAASARGCGAAARGSRARAAAALRRR